MSDRTIRPSCGSSLPLRGLLGTALIVSLSLPAGAQTPPACSDPRILIEGPLGAAWAQAVLALCDTLTSLPDLDPNVVVRIISSQPDVILEASLPDGRTALRRVHAPAHLRATLEALATVPARPAPTPAPTVIDRPAPTVPQRDAPAASRAHRSSLGLELGFSADVRMEGTPAYLSGGPAAYVALRPGPWMVALQLRWQEGRTVVRHAGTGFELSTAVFGFVVARRFSLRPAVQLDVGVTASLHVQTQEHTPRGGGEDDEVGTSAIDARFGPLVRVVIGRGAWRGLVSLDTDLSPVRLRHPLRHDSSTPAFPSFGVGLNVGACWGWAEP